MDGTHNRTRRLIGALVLTLGFTSACALTTRNVQVSDLHRNPGRYQDRSITIDGVVKSSWGIPLAPFRLYTIDDGTGELTVISQGTKTPTKGAHVHVKGQVEEVAVLGGQPLGLHLREEKLDVKRR